MILNLNNLKYYFLTCNNEKRRVHMINEFKEYDITEVNPIIGICKNKSGASGFSKILDLASKNQNRSKPFQPFVIFEDDVKKYRDFPDNIDIPDDADILYIGLSNWGMTNHCRGRKNVIVYKEINQFTVRIFNMLSLHGIIVCSAVGLLAIQRCMMEGFFKNQIWDNYVAQIQPYYNVYALKKPLVFQFKEVGGQQEETSIEIKEINGTNENLDIIPEKWINKNNVSVIMGYNKTK